ncbi:MAG: hypothetical protein AAGI07_01065 [Bacteroidota bacterium]
MPSKQFFFTLRILFFALLFGQTLFAAVAYFIYGLANGVEASENDLLVYVSVLFSIMAIGAVYILKPKLVATAATKRHLAEKLKAYTSASLVQWGIIEGANILNIILFMLTANKITLVFFLALILVYIPTRPDLRKIADELRLSRDEARELGL